MAHEGVRHPHSAPRPAPTPQGAPGGLERTPAVPSLFDEQHEQIGAAAAQGSSLSQFDGIKACSWLVPYDRIGQVRDGMTGPEQLEERIVFFAEDRIAQTEVLTKAPAQIEQLS